MSKTSISIFTQLLHFIVIGRTKERHIRLDKEKPSVLTGSFYVN
jgi:hypothetical protein